MKTRLVVILSVIVGLFAQVAFAALAQDTAGCSADSLTALVSTIQDANGTALTAIKAGDTQTAIDALSDATERVGLMKAVCAGLSFEGEDATVLGPVEIPEGTYRATATTAGYMIVQVTPTDGDCDDSGSLFLLTKGKAADGAETVFQSGGCKALIEISNLTAPWTLTFEKVG